jgi:hypothetical protein
MILSLLKSEEGGKILGHHEESSGNNNSNSIYIYIYI